MPKGFFITGTDTGVGKTLVARALIKVIGALGLSVGAMKPVETGCIREGEVLIPPDGMSLKSAARMDEPVTQIVPYCLENPLAPLTASEMEGSPILPGKIKRAAVELEKRYGCLIVEGVGGLLVPIAPDYFVLDMARDFGLPLIVVTRPTLGTINHTLLTVRYALKEGLGVAGVIVNYSTPPQGSLAEEAGSHALRALLPVPLIGVMPYMADSGAEGLGRAAMRSLDIEVIKKYL